ncbi:MAG TPA: sodium:calcium antiporter [Pelomicrobium sp.]|nr:sodium:calcium antiporter [Pelomicrobium sp.]
MMPAPYSVFVEFAVCGAVILTAGRQLSRYGDVIAEKTGLGGTWIGLVLLATVTSLPELVTGVTAVTVADQPDLAVGNVLGACVINLAMIVLLDALFREESLYTRASRGHVLSAGFGTILLAFVGVNLLWSQRWVEPAIGHVGLYTPIIAVVYVAGLRTLFRYELEHREDYVAESAARYPDVTLRQALTRYAVAAAFVVAAGVWLPFIGERMADAMGWHESFVGSLFLAFATTLPEITVTVAALRIGAINLAIGNLFGSNLFNIFILAIDDVAYLRGPLLAHVSPVHAVTILSAVVMTGMAIVAFFYRPKARLFKTIGWASLVILMMYLFNAYTLYLYGTEGS